MPDVKLRLEDESTGIVRETLSGKDGGFVFVTLPAGSYKLTVSAPGFRTAVFTGVIVETARTRDVAVQLATGETSSSVGSIIRVQPGRPFKLVSNRDTVNQYDSGVVLTGVTASQMQIPLTLRPGPNRNISFVDPSLLGGDGRANPQLLPPATTAGSSGNSSTYTDRNTCRPTCP